MLKEDVVSKGWLVSGRYRAQVECPDIPPLPGCRADRRRARRPLRCRQIIWHLASAPRRATKLEWSSRQLCSTKGQRHTRTALDSRREAAVALAQDVEGHLACPCSTPEWKQLLHLPNRGTEAECGGAPGLRLLFC